MGRYLRYVTHRHDRYDRCTKKSVCIRLHACVSSFGAVNARKDVDIEFPCLMFYTEGT